MRPRHAAVCGRGVRARDYRERARPPYLSSVRLFFLRFCLVTILPPPRYHATPYQQLCLLS